MSEIFLTIIKMSLTASYVILLVLLVRLLLKKSPKIISYVLWGVVAFRLIIPFSFESVFSLIPRSVSTTSISTDHIYSPSPQVDNQIRVVDSMMKDALSVPATEHSISIDPLKLGIEIGAYIWVIGLLVLLIYSFISVYQLKGQLKSAELIENNIFGAKNLKTPFVLGVIRPRIYLPLGLDVDERSYIILHEQTHIHRKDHIIKILGFLILSIHWFNPLVWLAFRLMSTDMELSCDERVLKNMNKDIKKPYASSLLSLSADRQILNGCPIAFGEGNIKGRIKNVLNYKRPRFWVVIPSVILVIGAGITLLANPIDRGADLSFLNPNSMLSLIGEQEQIKIESSEYGDTTVSGSELAKWLDLAENDWKIKNISKPYELSPSIIIHVDDEARNEIRFFEEKPTLMMTVYKDEFRYYMIPEEDYVSMKEMAGSGYPQVQSISFIKYVNSNEVGSVKITDSKIIMQLAVLLQRGEKYRPSLLFDSTQNDNPPVADYVRIEMSGEEAYYVHYLYSEDGKDYYVDKPYDHINRIDVNTANEINAFFANTGDEQVPEQVGLDVEGYLTIIMSSPMDSSNPQDYINAHEYEYESIKKCGDDALQYMLAQFEAGNSEGLRGQIMLLLCKELLGVRNNVTDASLSPQEWYNALSIRQETILPNYAYDGQDPIEQLVYDTEIERAFTDYKRDGFIIAASRIFGSYEEEDMLKVFVCTFLERYRLYGSTLTVEGGSVVPAAITYRKADNGRYVLEKYEQASDGSYFSSSIKKYCTMPVSGKKIKGLADKILKYYSDYEDLQELLYDNLYKHLKNNGISDATITDYLGEIIFSMNKYKP